MVPVEGIEPSLALYEGAVLPLNDTGMLVRARGIEPTIDQLKAGSSSVELYPRIGARPRIRTEKSVVLSDTCLPLHQPRGVGGPAESRTRICRFGLCRDVHFTTEPGARTRNRTLICRVEADRSIH